MSETAVDNPVIYVEIDLPESVRKLGPTYEVRTEPNSSREVRLEGSSDEQDKFAFGLSLLGSAYDAEEDVLLRADLKLVIYGYVGGVNDRGQSVTHNLGVFRAPMATLALGLDVTGSFVQYQATDFAGVAPTLGRVTARMVSGLVSGFAPARDDQVSAGDQARAEREIGDFLAEMRAPPAEYSGAEGLQMTVVRLPGGGAISTGPESYDREPGRFILPAQFFDVRRYAETIRENTLLQLLGLALALEGMTSDDFMLATGRHAGEILASPAHQQMHHRALRVVNRTVGLLPALRAYAPDRVVNVDAEGHVVFTDVECIDDPERKATNDCETGAKSAAVVLYNLQHNKFNSDIMQRAQRIARHFTSMCVTIEATVASYGGAGASPGEAALFGSIASRLRSAKQAVKGAVVRTVNRARAQAVVTTADAEKEVVLSTTALMGELQAAEAEAAAYVHRKTMERAAARLGRAVGSLVEIAEEATIDSASVDLNQFYVSGSLGKSSLYGSSPIADLQQLDRAYRLFDMVESDNELRDGRLRFTLREEVAKEDRLETIRASIKWIVAYLLLRSVPVMFNNFYEKQKVAAGLAPGDAAQFKNQLGIVEDGLTAYMRALVEAEAGAAVAYGGAPIGAPWRFGALAGSGEAESVGHVAMVTMSHTRFGALAGVDAAELGARAGMQDGDDMQLQRITPAFMVETTAVAPLTMLSAADSNTLNGELAERRIAEMEISRQESLRRLSPALADVGNLPNPTRTEPMAFGKERVSTFYRSVTGAFPNALGSGGYYVGTRARVPRATASMPPRSGAYFGKVLSRQPRNVATRPLASTAVSIEEFGACPDPDDLGRPLSSVGFQRMPAPSGWLSGHLEREAAVIAPGATDYEASARPEAAARIMAVATRFNAAAAANSGLRPLGTGPRHMAFVNSSDTADDERVAAIERELRSTNSRAAFGARPVVIMRGGLTGVAVEWQEDS